MLRNDRTRSSLPAGARWADVTLRRCPTGLLSFEVFGTRDGRPARATWDGHTLRLSAALRDLVVLPAGRGLGDPCTQRDRSIPTPAGDPMELVEALVQRLDHVDRVDYVAARRHGIRRGQWRPDEVATPPRGSGVFGTLVHGEPARQ